MASSGQRQSTVTTKTAVARISLGQLKGLMGARGQLQTSSGLAGKWANLNLVTGAVDKRPSSVDQGNWCPESL